MKKVVKCPPGPVVSKRPAPTTAAAAQTTSSSPHPPPPQKSVDATATAPAVKKATAPSKSSAAGAAVKPASASGSPKAHTPKALASPNQSIASSTAATSSASPKAGPRSAGSPRPPADSSAAASPSPSPPSPLALSGKTPAPATTHVDPAPVIATAAVPKKKPVAAAAAKPVAAAATKPAAAAATPAAASKPVAVKPAAPKTAPPKASAPKPAAAAAPPPAGPPKDDPDVAVKARKYVYDYVRSKWMESDCEVRVLHPNRGLSQGAMRVCFEIDELLPDGTWRPMVAKMFRRNITHVVEKDYFNECQAQCLCEEFASNFNEMPFCPVPPSDAPNTPPVERPHVEFVQCHIVRVASSAMPAPYKTKRTGFFSYRTEDTQAMMFAMEPKLSGFFTKYTNNYGAVYATHEVKVSKEEELRRSRLLRAGEAFSHFTLVESGGSMLVCDLQGVENFLTDPQIHTEDGKGLGMGNMGQQGIDKWVEKHQCNEYCDGFALQRLELASLVRGGRQESYYNALNARLQSQSPVRPQDLVPMSKPLEEMTDDEKFEYTIRLSQLLES